MSSGKEVGTSVSACLHTHMECVLSQLISVPGSSPITNLCASLPALFLSFPLAVLLVSSAPSHRYPGHHSTA